MTEERKNVSSERRTKPALPPKPKIFCKPEPPPKPAHLSKLKKQSATPVPRVDRSANNIYKCKQNNITKVAQISKRFFENTERTTSSVKTEWSDAVSCTQICKLITNFDKRINNSCPNFNSGSINKNYTSNNNINSNSDKLKCVEKHSLAESNNNNNTSTEKIHIEVTRRRFDSSLKLDRESSNNEDPQNRWSCGSPPSISSTDSSVYSDASQNAGALEDDDDTHTLEKLSDIECSARSNSTSPVPKSDDPCSSSSASLVNASPTYPHNGFELCASDTNNRVQNELTNSQPSDYNHVSEARRLKIYNIAKEMMTSEEVFCNVLSLLSIDFRKSVIDQGCIIPSCNNGSNAKGNRYSQNLTEEELDRILNYLPQLQNFSEGFLADLKQRLTDWDKHNKIADIIVTKGPFLKMYSSYIRDFEHQCALLDEACSKHPSFAKAVQNFESSDLCSKLGVKHYMLKPVQRIPQYRLLFQSYLELLPTSSPDIHDATRALAILEEVANHANDTIKIEDKVSELLSLQRRLYRSHDGAQPELIKPGREVLKQGELMKHCRRGMQPRYFVLLSDGMLYTSYSSNGSGLLRLNTELPLEGMKVSKPIADDFSAELTIRATQRSFTLQARSESERDEWLTAVQSAIDANIVRRSTFLAASTAAYSPPSLYDLGKQAPVWIPDNRVTMCQVCTAEFSLTFRRHHCRACGKVVCDLCSSNKAPLEYKKHQTERVCDYCYESLFSALQVQIDECQDSVVDTAQDNAALDDQSNSTTTDQTYDYEDDDRYFKRVLTLSDLKKLRQSFKKGFRDSMKTKGVRKPERLLEVCGNDSGSQMRGYLRRAGKRCWFVLKEKVMYQYAAPEDVCAQDSLPVLGYTLDASDTAKEGAEPSFTLKHPNQEDIVFFAETLDLAHKWVAAVQEATVLG